MATIKGMVPVHMTDKEVTDNFAAVLENISKGAEVIVEQDHRPVALIRSPTTEGRLLSDVIAALEASGANAMVDEDFARDVQAGIDSTREPWNPPSWE